MKRRIPVGASRTRDARRMLPGPMTPRSAGERSRQGPREGPTKGGLLSPLPPFFPPRRSRGHLLFPFPSPPSRRNLRLGFLQAEPKPPRERLNGQGGALRSFQGPRGRGCGLTKAPDIGLFIITSRPSRMTAARGAHERSTASLAGGPGPLSGSGRRQAIAAVRAPVTPVVSGFQFFRN